MSQTQLKSTSLLSRLEAWQGYWLVFLAAWVPVSITAIWIGLIVGALLWLAIMILTWKEGAFSVPLENNLSRFQSFKAQALSISGLTGAPFLLPIFLFVLAVFLSGVYVGIKIDGKGIMHGLEVGGNSIGTLRPFLVYPWVYQTLKRAPQAKSWSLCAILTIGSFSCLYAPVEPYVKQLLRNLMLHPQQAGMLENLVVSWHPFIKWVTGSRADFAQGTGFLEQPMAFAGQMQILLMFALSLLLCRGYKKLPAFFARRYCAMAIAFAITLGIVFAAERSAWLGAFFGVVILCGAISRKTLVRSLLALVLVGGLSFALVPLVQDRVDSLFKGNDPSISARLLMWQKSLDLFKEEPLFGHGIRRFPHVDIKSAMPDKGYLDHAHSNYLHILATTGLVGFAAYIFMLVTVFKATAAQSKSVVLEGLSAGQSDQCQYDRALALALLAATAALCVSGLFEYNFGTGHVRLTYFFMLAFITRKI